MRLWSYCIAENQKDPCRERLVWAPSVQIALLLIDHPDANVYELPLDSDDTGPDVLNPKVRPARFAGRAEIIPFRRD